MGKILGRLAQLENKVYQDVVQELLDTLGISDLDNSYTLTTTGACNKVRCAI